MMKKKNIASIVLFCLAVTAMNAHAQKVWQKIEFGLDDKIPSNERSPSGIFFRDTMNGFISANARGFRTIDGGQSWDFGNAPIPHSLFSDGYGSSFGNDRVGYYTQDNGETWSLIQPSIADPSMYFCLLGFGSQNLTHPTPFPFPALRLVF